MNVVVRVLPFQVLGHHVVEVPIIIHDDEGAKTPLLLDNPFELLRHAHAA